MAPLNPNSTIRFYCDYSTGNVDHTFLIRANALFSPANVGLSIDAIFTALAPVLQLVTVNVVRFSALGSNISNPVTTGIEGNVYGAGSGSTFSQATAISFVGRSSGGRRTRLAIFGYEASISDYRLNESESTEVAAVIPLLNAPANGFLAIDGLKSVWYPFGDISVNAYWQRELRS